MHSIQVKKEFPASIDKVFDLMSKHATYNIAFTPMQVQRIKDSADAEHPDGLGSVLLCSVSWMCSAHMALSCSPLPV